MVLDSVEEVLDYAGVKHTRLDGNTKASERGDILQSFTNEPSIEVLLLSVRSGGVRPRLPHHAKQSCWPHMGCHASMLHIYSRHKKWEPEN